MDLVTSVQTLDEAVFISLYANNIGKGMNPSGLPSAINKKPGRLGSLVALVRQPVYEKENSEFKPAILHLKEWISVSFCLW